MPSHDQHFQCKTSEQSHSFYSSCVCYRILLHVIAVTVATLAILVFYQIFVRNFQSSDAALEGVVPHAVHLRELVLEVGQLAYQLLADWYGEL